RAALAGTPARYETIAWENLTLDGGAVAEPGVPAGFRRTGTFERARLPVYDRYVATAFANQPDGYAIDARFADVVAPLLRAHGIAFVRGADPTGHLVVPAGQPLGALAAVLLEPESDDGFSAWNVFA
ncbi:MAG: hypothetical protein IAI48_12080, partial [Candidatus Eremiobacteraeota bacterium]|nr:hypothetical protein [Candidatus Eremiobacteraeota bacterium]